jgi:hypothetical protein
LDEHTKACPFPGADLSLRVATLKTQRVNPFSFKEPFTFISANQKLFTMPKLVSQLTGEEWNAEGPQTPAQKFWAKYGGTIDSKVYDEDAGARFYAKDVVFHNTNNATYRGPHEMWEW